MQTPKVRVRKWVLIACAGGGTFLATVCSTGRRADGLPQALHPFLVPPTPGQPIQAAVVLQRADCSGNLRVLDLLHTPRVAPSLRLAVLWFAGPASDSSAIRRALPPWTVGIPLRRVPRSVLRDMRRLGHHETPLHIVLDDDGHIRFTSRSPRSLREFAGLRRIVEGLTWIEAL